MAFQNQSRRKVVVKFGTRGFTLIELMIVVALMAVIAAVALPSYFDSVRKGRRSDAVAEVAKVEQAQERWRANNIAYNGADVSSAATGLRVIPATTVATNYITSSGYYNIAISGATATNYIVTATARSGTGQTKDTNCQCMRVRWVAGNPTYEAANTTSGSCGSVTWVTTNAASCWRR